VKLSVTEVRAKIQASAAVATVQAAAAQIVRLSIALGSFVKILRYTDTATTSETKAIVVGKALADSASALETISKGLTRGLSDSSVTSDNKTFVFAKAADDVASVTEAYTRMIGKVLSDTVTPTDDIDVTTADDEQNITLDKTLADAVAMADVLQKTVAYLRSLSDAVTTSDETARVITKSFADVVTAVDLINIGQGVISGYEETATTLDEAIRAFDKVLADAATISDVASKGFGKTLEIMVSQSDAAVIAAGKGLTDGASPSDSGNLISQNYVSEDFFAQGYVGVERTF
jgi:hypothetical protein